MATSNEDATSKSQKDDALEAMEKQVTQLRREISKINRTLAQYADEAGDEVTGWYDSATGKASRAASALRSQAQSVSGTVRENPGTVSSAMLIGGVIGLMVGVLLNQHSGREPHWFDRR